MRVERGFFRGRVWGFGKSVWPERSASGLEHGASVCLCVRVLEEGALLATLKRNGISFKLLG